MYNPAHPGDILLNIYMVPMFLTGTDVARMTGISRQTISEIINKKTRITKNTALKLGLAFETTPELWLQLQKQWDWWESTRTVVDFRRELGC